MKKKLAFSIAGATAAVVGGWKLVQQLVDRDDDPATFAATPPAPATAPAPPAKPEASKAELYKRATELGIKGRSKMSKTELLKAIQDAS